MRIFVSILVNLLSILCLLKVLGEGYDVMELINDIIFSFSFGLGIPEMMSGILAVIVLLLPGIAVYFLWNYLIKILK